MNTVLWLFVVVVALNVIDVLTTMAILEVKGSEQTPIVLWAMKRFGDLEGMLVLKVPLLTPIGVLLVPGYEYADLWGVRLWFGWVLIPLVVRYVWVVDHNVRVLKRIKGAL